MAARSWASPGASAAWSPGLWTLGLAPASGDDVTIGGSATSYTVTLNIDSPAINSLTLGTNGGAGNATLDVGTHNLNVTGGSSDTTPAGFWSWFPSHDWRRHDQRQHA